MASAGVGIQIDSENVKRLLQMGAKSVAAAKKEILDRGSIMTQAEMRLNAPVHDGELRASIRPKWQSADTVVIFSDKKYAPAVEFGRKPNGKMPPYQKGTPLEKWVRDKMGADVPPFLVARSISRKGTKGSKFAAKSYAKMKPAIMQMSNQVVARTIAGLK